MRVEVQLPSWLEGVDGWLGEEIAGVLFRSARETARRRPDPCVVEIGSWMGRSTIVIAKGLLDGEANGTVHAIDPHEIPGTRKVAEDRLAQLRANLATAGVEDVVEVVAARSHDARPKFDDASVDMLFVDGDHSHEGVRLDIDDWTSSLRAPAIVGFHDFQLSGVRRALWERVLVRRSAFRRARWSGVGLFFDYDPSRPRRVTDEIRLYRAEVFLGIIALWRPGYDRLQRSQRPGLGGIRKTAKWFQRNVLLRILAVCLPKAR
jgi:predicted O-methyltransferase YrrM